MVEGRKQAVSIRMSASDIRKVKRLAERIGVHDSDIVRFAVKGMLERLGPLHDPEVRGQALLPVLVESGEDLVRFFELDAPRLEALINDGVEEGQAVDREDVSLIAMRGVQQPYAALKLSRLKLGSTEDFAGGSLRQYLYDKYVYRDSPGGRATPANGTSANGGHGHE